MMRRRTSLFDRRGFTLAEVLIVVAIMALLISISVPVYSKAYDKAKRQMMESNALIISAVMEEYLTELYEDGKPDPGWSTQILGVPLGNPRNPLYNLIEGGNLEDASIMYIYMNRRTGEYLGLEIEWDGYMIKYVRGSEIVIEKM